MGRRIKIVLILKEKRFKRRMRFKTKRIDITKPSMRKYRFAFLISLSILSKKYHFFSSPL